MKDLTLVVLAAGLGSRYGGLKQIEPLGPTGEILLDYSVHDAVKAGFSNIVFIVKQELKDDFHEVIGRRAAKIANVDYAIQGQNMLVPDWFEGTALRGAKPWGTAHAVLCAEKKVHTPFVVINADDFYGAESYRLLAEHLSSLQSDTDFAMAGYVLENTLSENGFVSRGVCEADRNGYLTQVTERLRIGKYDGQVKYEDSDGTLVAVSPKSVVSMNIWGFTQKIFPLLDEQREDFFRNIKNVAKEEFLLPTAVDKIIKAGKASVKVLKTAAQWYGITYKEDTVPVKAALSGLVSAGVYPTLVK